MRIVARIAGILAIGGSVVLLSATHRVAAAYMRRQGFDWDFALPYVPPIIAIATVLMLAFIPGPPRSMRRAVLIGLALSAHLYLLVPAAYLIRQYDLIRADGTAFWGAQTIPAVVLFPPMLLVAAAVAAVAQFIARVIREEEDGS